MFKKETTFKDNRSAEMLQILKEDYEHAADVAQNRDWKDYHLSSSSDEDFHPGQKVMKGPKISPGIKADIQSAVEKRRLSKTSGVSSSSVMV